jgi:cardiolipin synthase
MPDGFDYGWVALGYNTEPEERLNRNRRLSLPDRVFAALFDWWLPKSVYPNHVTIVRFLVIPVLLIVVAMEWYSIAVPLFILLGLTDVMDGSLARVRGQISEWGIVFDSVCDKAFIMSVALVIVMRQFGIGIILLLLAAEGAVVLNAWFRYRRGILRPANGWGKTKMVSEVVGLSALLVFRWNGVTGFLVIAQSALTVAVGAAIISILWKRDVID